MSTIENTGYCNNTTDLLGILPELQAYDRKRLVSNWQTYSGSVYRSDSVGYVAMLYKDGKELGAVQSSLGNVDTEGEWFLDEAFDSVFTYSAADPNESSYEAGEDFSDLKTRVVKEQAERLRSYVGRPILSRQGVGTQSASGRNYDWLIVNANATLAVSELVKSTNPELGMALEKRIIDPETSLGLLDLLKSGEYKLWNEVAHQDQIRTVTVNAATTSAIVDTRGNPSTEWDIVKIVIDTGGTLTSGSASSVIYSTYGKDSTGLKISKMVDGETITGGWDSVGHNMYVRFSAGVLTTSDEFEFEMSGAKPENAEVKNMSLYR